jgi:hypothetical protein
MIVAGCDKPRAGHLAGRLPEERSPDEFYERHLRRGASGHHAEHRRRVRLHALHGRDAQPAHANVREVRCREAVPVRRRRGSLPSPFWKPSWLRWDHPQQSLPSRPFPSPGRSTPRRWPRPSGSLPWWLTSSGPPWPGFSHRWGRRRSTCWWSRPRSPLWPPVNGAPRARGKDLAQSRFPYAAFYCNARALSPAARHEPAASEFVKLDDDTGGRDGRQTAAARAHMRSVPLNRLQEIFCAAARLGVQLLVIVALVPALSWTAPGHAVPGLGAEPTMASLAVPRGKAPVSRRSELGSQRMITGYARHVDGLPIPPTAQDLFAGWAATGLDSSRRTSVRPARTLHRCRGRPPAATPALSSPSVPPARAAPARSPAASAPATRRGPPRPPETCTMRRLPGGRIRLCAAWLSPRSVKRRELVGQRRAHGRA